MPIILEFKVLSSNRPPFINNAEVIIDETSDDCVDDFSNYSITDFLADKPFIFYKIKMNYGLNIKNYELVVAGQYDNVNGWEPELAPALEPSEKTLLEYFGDDLNYLSFYLRPILSPQNLGNQ